MLEIKFDNVAIDSNGIKGLSNTYELYKDNFYLGAIASNTFKLEVAKHLMPSKPTEVKIEDDNNNYVLEVDKIEETDNSYEIELTDKMLRFNFLYDAKPLIDENRVDGESTTTIQDILNDICDKADIECNYTLTTANHIVDWWDNRISARDYISMIAEKEATFVRFENDELMFIPVNSPSKKTINEDEIDELKIGEGRKITRVVYDNGVGTFWEFGDESGNTLYLDSNNVYIIDEDDVEDIYNKIKDFEFYSITVGNCPIDSSVLAGDVITFKDRNDNLYPTIAQYSLSYFGEWLGGYSLDIKSTIQEETSILGVFDSVKSIRTEIDRVNNEFGIIAEEIEKLTDYIRNVGTTGNYLMLPDTPRSGGAINKLRIRGFDLRPLYPGMTYPSENTYPGALSFYTLVFDTIPTFDNEPNYVFVNSPIPLQKIGDVYDEISIEANKVKVIQRIGYDFDNEQWSVLSSPITHELNDVLLPTFDGDTYISVKYFDNLIYDAEYLIKNDLTSNFATQLESSSQFKMSKNEIEAKVDKDGLISAINLSPENAKILASRIAEIKAEQIKLEGLTTVNENFKVLLDGSIEANNGTFRGDIYLPDGGRIVGGDGLLSMMVVPSNIFSFAFVGGNAMLPLTPIDRLEFQFVVPKDFTIIEAYVIINHQPCHNIYGHHPKETTVGRCRNLKLYKSTNYRSGYIEFDWDGGDMALQEASMSYVEISNAFGANGFTGSTSIAESVKSSDISSHIDSSASEDIFNVIKIQSSSTGGDMMENTGSCNASLVIIGYNKFT